MVSMKVKIYTTPACPYCKMLKQFLNKHKIVYEEVDVSKDKNALRKIVEKSGQIVVPQIEINNKIIVGFDENVLKRELHV